MSLPHHHQNSRPEGNSLAGIAAYGAYVPKYRLGGETLGWNSAQERAVANFDEDSVTMAVAAGRECLHGQDRAEIDGLIFASTTPPYAEKQSAAIVATALDLGRDLFTTDITGVLRAGTSALRSALDAVIAGSARRVLVIASDHRQGAPRGEIERNSGDGAAALLVANDGVIAQWEGHHSITENMLDSWRSAGDPFVRSWEERFATEEGLERLVGEAVRGFFEKQSITPADVAKVALYAPDARRHAQLASKLGFQAEQVQDPLFGRLGNTGAAFSLMLLTQALADADPEQLILLVSYGDGSDVLAFRTVSGTTSAAGRPLQKGLGLERHLESKKILGSYELYARWREVWPTDDAARRPAPASPSVTALWREEEKNLRFHGGKCNSCGYIQYPPQRVCVNCQSRDDSSPVPLSERPGTVFTYSMDYIAGTIDTPLVIAVVDFEGGGRALCMMTDREVDEVSVGMPVEMSFRKLRVVNGIHNYYWKAVPRRF